MAKIVLVSLVHNRKDLVRQAINSATAQTLDKSKWVYLVLDNGSTDGADQVCEALAKKHSHIIFERLGSNLGQQKAFNLALNTLIPQHCPEAKIFAVLDSDDLLLPFALEEVEKMYDAHPEIGMTYSGFSIINEKNAIVVKDHPKARYVQNQFTPEGQRIIRNIFISQNPIGHMRTFSIQCLRDIGGFNTAYQYATDYNAAGRVLQRYPVVKINKVLYLWRQHKNQVEKGHSVQQTADWKAMQVEFAKIFKERGLL